jgi:hypothetical protein
MTTVGFEPTPLRTRTLTWRLRPLGHIVHIARIAGAIRRSSEGYMHLNPHSDSRLLACGYGGKTYGYN